MAIKRTEKPITPLQKSYWSFWKGFNDYTSLDFEFQKEFKVHPYPSIRSYQDYHIGQSFAIVAGVNFKKNEIRVGAYFGNLNSFHFWYNHGRNLIESSIDKVLVWKLFSTKGSAFLYSSANLDDSSNWQEAYSLIAKTMISLKLAFTEDVKIL